MFNPNICIMTKTRRWPSLLLAAFTVLSFGACEDWGQMDPPAGTDVYPKLEQVYSETFGGNFDPTTSMTLFAYDEGDVPTVVVDEERDSVLHLANGYARLFNPLTNYKAQDGVSLTFWVKQALFLDEETEEPLEEDLDGALFSFQNFNGTQRMFMTANGYLKYEGVDGEWESTDLLETKTGMLNNAGEWHYVAVTVKDNGYSVFVDGEQRIDKLVPASEFPFSKVVQFMAGCDHIYLGYGSDVNTKEMWMDDLKIYRNQITNKEQARPGSGGGEVELPKFNIFFVCEASYMDMRTAGYMPYINNTENVIVGNTDCTTGWWSAFSDSFKIKDGQTIHIRFKNHSSGVENWHNWVLVATNDIDRGGDGYAEYFALRADNYGWGDANYNGANITSNYNWDTFKAFMNGAFVDMTITRTGTTLNISAVQTSADGQTVHTQTFKYENADMTEEAKLFLTCESAYLEFAPDAVVIGDVYKEGEYVVGATDFTNAWWTTFSQYHTIEGDTEYPYVFQFYDHSLAAQNYQFWVMAVTTAAERGADGYKEYMVLRSDAYGWGDFYNAANMTSSFNWDTYPADMNGSFNTILITRKGSRFDMDARAITTTGASMPTYKIWFEGLEE